MLIREMHNKIMKRILLRQKLLIVTSCFFILVFAFLLTSFSNARPENKMAESGSSVDEGMILFADSAASIAQGQEISDKTDVTVVQEQEISNESKFTSSVSSDTDDNNISNGKAHKATSSVEADKPLEIDYKQDKTLTIQGITYILQYKSTEERSGGQLTDRHCYESISGEEAKYDTKTGKLLSFYKYSDNQKKDTVITESDANLIAEDFLKTQCDISLYKQDCCEYNEQRNRFSIKYSRMHLDHLAESIYIWVSNAGEILHYSGNFDTENIIFSVKEVNEDKAREAMVKLLGDKDYVFSSNYVWTISDNNKPAIEEIIKNDSGWSYYVIEINQDGSYIAYSKYGIQTG